MAVDETLVATKGRTPMLQYIPSKAAKFGVKFWVLAESLTGYIQHMNCYLGRVYQPTLMGTLQGTQVVMDILRDSNLLNKAYHVVCDSFFCSLDLARKLLEAGTFLTGTIRSNRIMPNIIKTAPLLPGQTIYTRQREILMAAHKSTQRRKPVRLLSTYVKAGEENGKPKIINVYNKYMGELTILICV